MMRRALQHIHISKPHNPIPYASAARIQDHFVRANLDYKLAASAAAPDAPASPPPPPTVLTMEMRPVYTFGRRHVDDPDAKRQIERLKTEAPGADCVITQRGGQVTFHGPGQLVAFPILDIKEYNLRTKWYIYALEHAAIATLTNDPFHLTSAQTTDNVGIWLSPTDKIGSVGVHLRRNISSHGVAVNLSTDLTWFEHIVACGLPDARAVSVRQRIGEERWQGLESEREGADMLEWFAGLYVDRLAEQLECGVEKVKLEDVYKE
ncbi:hypothetical protein BZA70DRAFT_266322 [Myxozyma melibiosi]|uniref:lipoyl(octanoyl) transferase n=1 Tax=Myxozyma melibiosi TaxID=54550 RepID=A0ABR1FCY9_9ASCO